MIDRNAIVCPLDLLANQWCKSDCRARVEQGNRTDNDTRIPTVDRVRMAIDRASCESVLVAIIGRRNDGWLNSLGPGLRQYDVRSECCLRRRDRSGGLFPSAFGSETQSSP